MAIQLAVADTATIGRVDALEGESIPVISRTITNTDDALVWADNDKARLVATGTSQTPMVVTLPFELTDSTAIPGGHRFRLFAAVEGTRTLQVKAVDDSAQAETMDGDAGGIFSIDAGAVQDFEFVRVSGGWVSAKAVGDVVARQSAQAANDALPGKADDEDIVPLSKRLAWSAANTYAAGDLTEHNGVTYKLATDTAALRSESPVANVADLNNLSNPKTGDCVAVTNDSGNVQYYRDGAWVATASMTLPVVAALASDEPGTSRSWFASLNSSAEKTGVVYAVRYGVIDDNTDVNDGTDASGILQHIIDNLIPPYESGWAPNTAGLATKGAYTIILPVTPGGTKRLFFKNTVVVPSDKNVLIKFEVFGSGAIDCPDQDYAIEFDRGGQGSYKGVENLILHGGGIDFVGNMNGIGIKCKNIQGIRCSDAVIRTIDKKEKDSSINSFNVTQYMWETIEGYLCERVLDLRATTYSKCVISHVRCFASYDTPLRVSDTGYTLTDFEFIGVHRNRYHQGAFVHIDTEQGTSAYIDMLRFRFGSEDTTSGVDIFQPPKQNIRVGGVDNADGVSIDFSDASSTYFSRSVLTGMHFQNESSNNADYGSYPVLYGIAFYEKYHSITVKESLVDGIQSCIFEGDVVAGVKSFGGNRVDVNDADAVKTNIFSNGGRGWIDVNKVSCVSHAALSRIAYSDDLSAGRWVKVANRIIATKDQVDSSGRANSATKLVVSNPSGTVAVYSNNVYDFDGRYVVHIVMRSTTESVINIYLSNADNLGEYVLNKSKKYNIGTEWQELIIPVGHVVGSNYKLYIEFNDYSVNDDLIIETADVWPGDVLPAHMLRTPVFSGQGNSNKRIPEPTKNSSVVAGKLHDVADAIPTATDDESWYAKGTVLHLSDGTVHRCSIEGAPGTWVDIT